MGILAAAGFAAGVVFAGWKAAQFAFAAPLAPAARQIPWALLLSFLRVSVGVGLAVLLSVPLAFVTFRRARVRQTVLSILQIFGSIPATAFFPLIAILMLRLRPRDERGVDPARPDRDLLLRRLQRPLGGGEHPEGDERGGGRPGPAAAGQYLRRVFVPAVLPSLVTGCVTAWGGGWNAIIFSEYVVAGGRRYEVAGHRGHPGPGHLRDRRPAGGDAEPRLDGGPGRPGEPRVLGPALPARGAAVQARSLRGGGLVLALASLAPRTGAPGVPMSDVSFPENQLRFEEPELAERIEAEIRAAALVQGPEEPPLECRILRREWSAPRGRLTIQLGRPGWVTNFAVPESPRPGQVREAVTQVLAGYGVPASLAPDEIAKG